MPADQQPQNPLQLGQTLYEVLDVTVIGTPKDASASRYNRVVCDSSGANPVESLNLGVQDQILDAKALSVMHDATQSVFVLTGEEVQIIGSGGGEPSMKSWPAPGFSRIVDLDPQQTAGPHLLLLGQDAKGVTFLQSLGCSTGSLSSPLRLPSVPGQVAGALLLRKQLDARLLVCAVHGGQLVVSDLGTSVLGPAPSAPTSADVKLGPVQAGATVGLSAASLIPGSADQQLVVTYPDLAGALHVAVLGWPKGTFGTIDNFAPDLSFAPSETPLFRVAAGSLLDNSVDQVVVGYPATYGGVAGCAALLLLELSVPEAGSPSLHLLSTYAAANTEGQPLASIDLHLAVGLFGEALSPDLVSPAAESAQGVLGVQLIGGGATFAQVLRGEASIMAGLVTVNPAEKAFPPLGAAPGTPQNMSTVMTIDYESAGFFAMPSDVTGQSVYLGPPTLSQALGKGQLLAIIQAPPFETGVSSGKPTLTFGQSVSLVKGYNVSSNKTWMFTTDTAATIGIAGQSLTHNVNNSYGSSFDQVDDNSTSTLLQMTSTITENDLIVLYVMSYYIWTYPVYRKSVQEPPDGTMAVIFPMTPQPQQALIPASDPSLGFRTMSQNGILLSYENLQHDGYDPALLLFDLVSAAVTDDMSGTTLTYDQTQMVTQNVTKSFMIHNSTTDSLHFSYSKDLFDYIPINFGLNMSESDSYSENDVQTTMVSHTTTMSVTITSGSVSDIGYEYLITPYIYQHQTMGCLMVTYDVNLSGKSWKSYYKVPRFMLQAVYPNTTDKVLAAFSRSISFQDKEDGTVDVEVEIFNNGLTALQNVSCDFYVGSLTLDKSGALVPPDTGVVGTRTLATLLGGARQTVQLNMSLRQEDQVVVGLYIQPALVRYYWGIYPPSAFSDLQGLRAALAVEHRRLIR